MTTLEKNLLADCCESQIVNITNTVKYINPATIKEALIAIRKANNIYVVGMRSSFAPAHFLCYGLNQIVGNCQMLTNSEGTLIEKIFNITAADLLIGICLPRYSRYTVELFKTIKEERKLPSIAITAPECSPLSPYADYLLPCDSHSLAFHNSLAGVMFVVEYLITAAALNEPDKTKNRLCEAEGILAKLKTHIS